MSGPEEAQRIDQYLTTKLAPVSRSFVEKLIEGGKVTVNKVVLTKPSRKVKATDKIEVDYDPSKPDKPAHIKLKVLYEDDDCVVIYKPAGVLSHSKGEFNPEASVASWLADKFSGLPSNRSGIVHRLDRATSGVMICAKNETAQKWLQKQFSLRKVKKTYVAIVRGHLKTPEAIIDMAIERNPKHPQTFRVGINGKPAITAYKVVKTSDRFSELELRPTTGRTHQLRVHLESIGHPIVGDKLYGDVKGDRLYLHASSLEITVPSRQRLVFETILPPEFAKLIK